MHRGPAPGPALGWVVGCGLDRTDGWMGGLLAYLTGFCLIVCLSVSGIVGYLG
ncbi:hypothetical protein BO71DRAFT_404283 [Aspergillus ellipticus CBS 707.79]|uniref:Uncharacterized protein n=1 Tax=Aspergillus ellipticus CBS 707.79 TaxID=1448320 RepID=A0A319DIF1_9EURO|nr:hypothetical protein BO71DRAFT_404283 [Aspergillus ellipticus CBS 707.79]